MTEYYILTQIDDEKNCIIEIPPKYMDAARIRLRVGDKIGNNVPDNFQLKMSDLSDGINIPDIIDSYGSDFIVNERTKALIEQHATVEIEYIPFKLLNHKGRVALDKCYIVNVLDTLDCVDTEKTQGVLSELMEGEYDSISKLYLVEDKIPANANMFRISMLPQKLVVREDIKNMLEKNNVTGAEFFAMGEEVELE